MTSDVFLSDITKTNHKVNSDEGASDVYLINFSMSKGPGSMFGFTTQTYGSDFRLFRFIPSLEFWPINEPGPLDIEKLIR